VLMVSLIIAFPGLVSVASKTDMKEQIELKVDLNQDGGAPAPETTDGTPQLNFSTEGDAKQESDKKDEGEIQLNFSSDTDKK